MADLSVNDIALRYGENEILKGVSIALAPGKVVALLGPSGSGKTTLLRAVAGLETPSEGSIRIGEQVFFDADRKIDVPAEKRGLGLVFQSYALWPHRSVFDNVAYGLKLRGIGGVELKSRVDKALAQIGLAQLAGLYPHQLSGAQQHRVALARALVYEPAVILLDEPLSNLDAKLREEARAWLRELIVSLGLSALCVTHDQVEAMAVADRIMLLRGGEVEQEGSPQSVYEAPNSALVADFMGSNNHLSGRLVSVDGDFGTIEVAGGRLIGRMMGRSSIGDRITALIRIERVGIDRTRSENGLLLNLETALYLGERWEDGVAGTCGALG